MISSTALLYVDVIASATIAGWTLARFPGQRPTSVGRALGLVLVALLVAQVSLTFIPFLIGLQKGFYVVMLGCVLPVFFCLFLTIGWLLLAILGVDPGPDGRDCIRADERAESRA